MLFRSLLKKGIRPPLARQSESGQIIIEYVLLLVIAVIVAAMVARIMVKNSGTDPGIVPQAWARILKEIGKDKADDIKRN